ncbi:unnamed protein product [Symbiodinium sp. CCMP2592]|nr:unnamed protein product [Symbiodinium sp. CCMP2592]
MAKEKIEAAEEKAREKTEAAEEKAEEKTDAAEEKAEERTEEDRSKYLYLDEESLWDTLPQGIDEASVQLDTLPGNLEKFYREYVAIMKRKASMLPDGYGKKCTNMLKEIRSQDIFSEDMKLFKRAVGEKEEKYNVLKNEYELKIKAMEEKCDLELEKITKEIEQARKDEKRFER